MLKTERTAVIGCHGMGQQVPFETLAEMAELLRKQDSTYPAPTTRFVALDGQQVPMATLEKPGSNPVDFYEVYWAPVTEGRVTILQTMMFLLKGISRGLSHSAQNFTRFVFGRFREYPMAKNLTLIAFGLLFATLALSLSILNFFGFSIAFLLHSLWFPDLGQALFLGFLPTLIVGIVAYGVVNAIPMAPIIDQLKGSSKESDPPDRTWLVWIMCLVAVLVDLIVVLKMPNGLHIGKGLVSFLDSILAMFGVLPKISELGTGFWKFTISTAWLIVLLFFIYIWNFVIQFFGDVAAYVSSNEVNTFAEIRAQIRDRADRIFRGVYGAKQHGYSRVIVVAHSLGSVIAYDALNTLILEEQLRESKSTHAASKTRLLLTYGSPLDKTAFFFRTQTNNSPIRESLAQDRQPLICDDNNRAFPWVNIYSPRDIFSGPLDFYDLPDKTNRNSVINFVDFDSQIPFMAHTQYTQTVLLGKVLASAAESDESLQATLENESNRQRSYIE